MVLEILKREEKEGEVSGSHAPKPIFIRKTAHAFPIITFPRNILPASEKGRPKIVRLEVEGFALPL